MQTRSLPVNSVDADKRTVEVTFTTGAAVRRRAWSYNGATLFDEVLEVSRSAVNLERLNAGAPALDSHSTYGTRSQLGVVERAWIEGKEGRALIRFPTKGVDDAADRMFAMVQEGIIRNVSVGYSLDEVRVEEPQKKGDVEKRIATRWTPFEVSFVTVPADAGAQVRGTEETFPVTIQRAMPANKEPSAMDEIETNTNETRTAPAVTVPPAPAAADASRAAPNVDAVRAAVEGERVRVSEITALGLRHGMPADFVAKHINSGSAVADVRAAVLDVIAARANETQISARGIDAQITRDEGDTIRAAVETAILHRASPSAVKLDDAARQWRGMSLMEMGRAFHEQTTGERLRGLGKMELASRLLGLDTGLRSGGMMSTSDFPAILANVVSKRLRSAYEVAPQNWKRLSRQNNAPDFKARAITQLSNLPLLKQIREGGEYTHAALADSKESYALATFGRVVTITRQSLINDDLGAFDRLPMLLGRAAAETESSLFWAIITSNGAMGDGKPLFDAAHGNLGTAGPIAIASLNEGRAAMRKQKGLAVKAADAEPLNLAPAFIVVSPDKETEAQQFLATTLYPQQGSQVNPFAGSLLQITEARLTGNAWYLFADPATIDTIEYAYLEGEEGLYTESRLGFEVDGIEIKGRLDFAAKAIDWRGMFKNGGN
ncbi:MULTISPECIES: prohead protease/major capsid protein fusion protein [unclassified Bradyrhizobium]|uniref:prohead protease/major capsid protein fusion protein n=1 Tax=unclassified Bradyrhizobium TaxID=2631580 RepID=UPI0028EBB566|nr:MULTISPECIES: prohead protease/major capsid protein fusion protein [unclassified Bradyrhizobium]